MLHLMCLCFARFCLFLFCRGDTCSEVDPEAERAAAASKARQWRVCALCRGGHRGDPQRL